MTKKTSYFSIRRKGFKICIFLFVCVFFWKPVLSQTAENKKNAFELLIKRQTYQWTPYDYTSYTERSISEISTKTDSVKQNQKVLIPFAFRYDQLERKFRIEISVYEIELANANTIVTRADSGGYSTKRQYFNPMLRSEAELNLYKIFDRIEDWKFFLGLGIRNINKYRYGYFLREGAYEEFFYTYGPQIVFRTDYRIWERFFLGLAVDLFYTEGNRFYKSKTMTLESISVSTGNSGVRGIYRGSEIDFSFAYQFSEAFKFYVGYSYIYSYFSYYGFNQTDLNLGTVPSNPFFNTAASTMLSHPIKSGDHDILRGFYFGISVCF
ncbi:LA_2444/LA_4059 family outer membrane protein [Leptospira santarosai]|uniref:LA_2444/LA_4059 family outer membrane protein n=1 Tax=Leptospira santarosai TaxID=28183 RepID=UPI0024AFADE4|nr:LA_2444/LA_4059 family outer membrane protein [Leptospira santarosai]MDI7174899.1 LA_2444/LA_4059 family outer membrane protein [Leptospira santarosai]MDI7194495.1 LA_2444/LA_4059 family outer membrane protein [Leptospira santarosai]MDO6398951.1 LA_2444/LA_4059 family outer membrane protein [Leptospira santarosai]MDO6404337.1 LA_2444/LA_4059 family outer membrane protein [Leptospira santarosai]